MKDDQFKASLHLPKTDFPMKANLPKKEPEMVRFWNENKIYDKVQKQNQNKQRYFLLDGPPYANGNLHLGHVLNKVLKDIVVKYYNLKGLRSPFVPTWDCHGLPIELEALKKIKSESSKVSDADLRKQCRKEAQFWMDAQKDSFKRLGVLARFDHAISTMDPRYEAEEVRLLAELAKKQLFVQGKKPVLWCFRLQTALAFSEAEYREHRSLSVYVRFNLAQDCKKLGLNQGTGFVIWTTTPWTLPANQAVCLNKKITYSLFKKSNQFYVIAKDLQENFEKETGLDKMELIKTFQGSDLEGLMLNHPFLDKQVPLILGDHVTLESGTGCVHTAPGHGIEDYTVGKQYSLKEYCPVDEKGHFDKSVPDELQGLFIFKANKVLADMLKKSGHLVFQKNIKHQYPYSARSDSPLIYRLTPQWFLQMDSKKFPVRSKALSKLDKEIRFIPELSQSRLASMLKNSPDWCLSRQRVWGVPIVVFYCTQCETPYLDPDLMNRLADKMESSKQGLEYYFTTQVEELTQGCKCLSCGGTNFTKGKDILDVWFDSGVEHAVFEKLEKESFPADLFLEGSDQHRGWFQTSLVSSVALKDEAPFKTLLTHGFVNDKTGKKMSKSKGNVIDPFKVIDKQGAEILRIWVASEDYSQDINAGEEIFQRVTETYRRFRNTFRFILGNLHDFEFKKHQVPFEQLSSVDKWALIKLKQLTQECDKIYSEFAFHRVYHSLNTFFTVTLSSFYLDIIKDRLYTFPQKGLSRRQAQTVLYHLIEQLLPLMAPITSFLSEEVYSYFPSKNHESIFLEDFIKYQEEWQQDDVIKLFDILFPLKENLNKQLEDLRSQGKLGSSLESVAHLDMAPGLLKYKINSFELCEFFGVSEVITKEGKVSGIRAELSKGKKCLRCWFYSSDLDSRQICSKCQKNLVDDKEFCNG